MYRQFRISCLVWLVMLAFAAQGAAQAGGNPLSQVYFISNGAQ